MTTTRARAEAKLARLTRKLYDANTPARTRRELSLEVSFLRQQLGAPTIDSMSAASANDEEC